MKKDLKLRIVSNAKKDEFIVEKKYFNIFWYSFNWDINIDGDSLFKIFPIFNIFVCGITFIISALICLIFNEGNSFLYVWKIIFSISEIGLILFIACVNPIYFTSYQGAEEYIKNIIKEDCSKKEITEFNWNGEKIIIEKKS